MDFKSYLQTSARDIDQELVSLLREFLSNTEKTNPKLVPFALGLINSCKGGKRVRGVLTKLGFFLSGGKSKEIIKIAAALEILHAAILIHDDIADKSLIRRGRPSLYQALSRPQDERVAGNHYGVSQAINLGDIGLYLPIKIISDSSFPGDYKLKVLSLLSQTIINTGWGQVMDVELTVQSAKFKVQSEKDIEFINLYKTAKYTIAGPLQIGAILGGANKKVIKLLGEFGENLGVAFQIRDDILDGEVESAEKAQSEALKYALKAKKVIPKITTEGKMRQLLEQMTEFMVNRDK